MAKDIPIDATFEELEVTSPISVLTKSVSSKGDEVEKMMSNGMNLSEKRVYHEPTCLICSSPYRDELEKKYLEKTSNKDIIELFKQKTGEEIGESLVENHILHHLTSGVREQQKLEYIHKIKRLNAPNMTTLERISINYAILNERVLGINSLVPSGEESIADIEKIKSSETARLMSAICNLLKLQASILGEMKSDGQLIYIPSEEFVNVFRDATRAAKTDREQELITSILDKLEALARRTQ